MLGEQCGVSGAAPLSVLPPHRACRGSTAHAVTHHGQQATRPHAYLSRGPVEQHLPAPPRTRTAHGWFGRAEPMLGSESLHLLRSRPCSQMLPPPHFSLRAAAFAAAAAAAVSLFAAAAVAAFSCAAVFASAAVSASDY